MIYFTSDNHYFHENIITYCKRPYSSIEEMNEGMVKRHNSIVLPNDTCYFLGDFAFGKRSNNFHELNSLFQRLNGKKILIKGNHDSKMVLNLNGWESINDLLEINVSGHKVILCHYAMKVWNKSHDGSFHLYGHSHQTLKEDSGYSFDIGCDGWDWKPVSIDTVINKMQWKKQNLDIFYSKEYIEMLDRDQIFDWNLNFNKRFL